MTKEIYVIKKYNIYYRYVWESQIWEFSQISIFENKIILLFISVNCVKSFGHMSEIDSYLIFN